MTTDPSSKPGAPEQVPIADPTLQALAPSQTSSVRCLGRRVRDLILDYALGSAILGLLPIPRFFTFKLLLAFGLIIKMSGDMGRWSTSFIPVAKSRSNVTMRLRRRQLLLGRVAAGMAATVGSEYAARSAEQARNAKRLDLNANDPTHLLQQIFEADAQKINAGLTLQAALAPPRPTISYNRERSHFLIQCSKLATQQYLTGKTIPSYDGSLKSLPAYFSELDHYTQLTSFKGHEAQVEDTIKVNVPTTAQSNASDPVEQQASEAQNTIGQTVKEVVKLRQLTPV